MYIWFSKSYCNIRFNLRTEEEIFSLSKEIINSFSQFFDVFNCSWFGEIHFKTPITSVNTNVGQKLFVENCNAVALISNSQIANVA